MQGGYTFKRNFYGDVLSGIKRQRIVFLLGPRRCGKTVCLRQLERELSNARYYNFKSMTIAESMTLFAEIKDKISENASIVFLLDEITYAHMPDREINELSILLSDIANTNTSVVFTGSQSAALESWGMIAFGGSAAYIHADFINYAEWLKYKGISEVSEKSYSDFVVNASSFHNAYSLRDYLNGCLVETINSNQKAINIIIGNDCSLLTVDTLVCLCVLTLFSLHNHVNAATFFSGTQFYEDLQYYFSGVCAELGDNEVRRRIEASFIGEYNHLKTIDLQTLKQGLLFLLRCGLITLTPVSSEQICRDFVNDLQKPDSNINYKDDIFSSYNICIAHPMFYVCILREVLGEYFNPDIPRGLLGSVVECHARGLLREEVGFEFRQGDAEIDYVGITKNIAIEFTVSNKKISSTNFDRLGKEYRAVLLSKDKIGVSPIWRIPYYIFLYLLSYGGIDKVLAYFEHECSLEFLKSIEPSIATVPELYDSNRGSCAMQDELAGLKCFDLPKE